jgi:hypothetical protein
LALSNERKRRTKIVSQTMSGLAFLPLQILLIAIDLLVSVEWSVVE